MPVSQHPSTPPAAVRRSVRPCSLPPEDGSTRDWEERSALFERMDLDSVPPPQRVSELGGSSAVGDVGELFNAYRAYVAKIGRRILGSNSDVDDLIQDVFLATVRDVHKLEDPARLASWLGTVTTRMAKRRRFHNSVRPSAGPDDPEPLLERVSQEGPSPESTADLAGNIQRVMSLPDELRTPWVLKHVEGRTLEDVAQQCDCSLSTVQRRLQAATGRLQKRSVPPDR
ncbi:MAG TPA: sigma-70 family RNA polymerase sigma factor [Polyangiaceae bacterium]|nr:sigma-70 family RNA polymerase sigma factor [Polyangiaceae bacterium]